MKYLHQYNDVDIDDMTPQMWNSMTQEQRDNWKPAGASFVCLACGFPVHFGGAPCAACEPELYLARSSRVPGARNEAGD